MLMFDHAISSSGEPTVVDRRNDLYRVTLEGAHYYEIGRTLPLMVMGRGVVDLVTPTQLVINEYGTTVEFRRLNVVQRRLLTTKELELLGKILQMTEGTTPGFMRSDSDTQRTGMDAAMRMMVGSDRSARQIARGDDDDDDDRRGPSLVDMMKRSNPGMLFDDDDDRW